MDKVIINSYEDFEKLVGQQIGVSDYLEVSQERINPVSYTHLIYPLSPCASGVSHDSKTKFLSSKLRCIQE